MPDMRHDDPTSTSAPSIDPMSGERRKKRSLDPLVALHYQLAHAKTDGALDAIVLADTAGILVAGAGSWVVCEELAAYAPLLAHELGQPIGMALPSRMEAMRDDVDVRAMSVQGQPMFLCSFINRSARARAHRPLSRSEATDQAARGVTRILETRA
jgi:hypothetical protein